jgi:hypothetical protein
VARSVAVLAISAWLAACGTTPDPYEAGALSPEETEQIIPTGIMLRDPEGRSWGAHLTFPVSIGLTQFDLDDVDLDDLASLSVVPTGEFMVPIDEHWTLLPYVGAGAAWQIGEREAAQDDWLVGLARGGLRAQRWQAFAERYRCILTTDLLYSVAFVPKDGVLGDWGTFDAALELRRNFGAPRAGPRFQPGVYAQAFWYWDPIEIEIDGATPEFLNGQVELGISLGSTTPYKLWKLGIPRTFLGVRTGGDLTELRIRFGRL